MGRTASIKRFTAKRPGQPLELHEDRPGRRAVLAELFASPWIVRASDLVRGDGSPAARRRWEPVIVQWSAESAQPAAFVRGGERYRVDEVLQVVAVERAWWDPRRRISRRIWRVRVDEGVYDLAFDRLSGSWVLIGVHD